MFNNTKHITDLIQDLTPLSSEDELWRVFHQDMTGQNFNRWRYVTHTPLRDVSGTDPFAGIRVITHKGEDLTDLTQCVNLSIETHKVMAQILRHIETPCFFEDIPQRLTISKDAYSDISASFKISEEEKVLIVPCFGARLNTGYFLFVTDKTFSNAPAEDLTLLSLKCQLGHSYYQSIATESQKPSPTLSPREKMILQYLAEGYSNFDISKSLGLSSHVINVYIKVIFKKTNSHNKTTAVLNGIALGLIK
jgi:DNA-binding CsgD family transcriptional regulator